MGQRQAAISRGLAQNQPAPRSAQKPQLPVPSSSSSSLLTGSTSAVADPTLYVDPVTQRQHRFRAGDTVILTGDTAVFAKNGGYAPLGTLLTVDAISGKGVLQLYSVAEPQQEGGIGVPAVTRNVDSVIASARPLPFEFSDVSPQALVQNTQIFTCARVSDVNPESCMSCDPAGQLFGPETYADRLNQVFNMVTDVRGGPGATRYTLFACPATIIRSGQPVTVANAACRMVIVATITGSTNTNRYALINTMDPIAFQAAYLYAYGLPVDDVSYYRAIKWSNIAEYQQLLQQLQGERIACLDVDAGWLDQHIRQLLAKGFEAKEIGLLAGRNPSNNAMTNAVPSLANVGSGRAAAPLATANQQRAFQQIVG